MTQVLSGLPHKAGFVTSTLGIGGTTTFLCNLGGELVRRGIAATVCSLMSEHPLAGDFNRAGIRSFCSPDLLVFEDRMQMVLGWLAQASATVVVANLSTVSYEALRYAPEGAVRVAMAHTDDPLVYDQIRHYAQHIDVGVAVSRSIQRRLSAVPEFADRRVEYIPCGVPIAAALGRKNAHESLRILYLGRVDREQKRVHLFPQILAELRKSGIAFQWTIAGRGSEEALLREEMVTSVPHQKVVFAGAVPYSSVPELLHRNDVFLLASDYEGLPLSLLEAMGHGLVPVVTDIESGIRDVVCGNCGFLIAADDTAGYAKAIIRLARDHALRERLARDAYEKVVREFSTAAMGDRWMQLMGDHPARLVRWDPHQLIRPILGQNSLRFHPALKRLRRLLVRFRA